ncbi:hypothetical protein BC826DRAFT_1191152 [Russula brevipes]|nr:hypothetical protein BC826DRAFT_1191152 [Russula brevipes]
MRARTRVRHTRTRYWMIQAKVDLLEVRQTGGRKLMRETSRDVVFTPIVWQCLSVDGTASLHGIANPGSKASMGLRRASHSFRHSQELGSPLTFVSFHYYGVVADRADGLKDEQD